MRETSELAGEWIQTETGSSEIHVVVVARECCRIGGHCVGAARAIVADVRFTSSRALVASMGLMAAAGCGGSTPNGDSSSDALINGADAPHGSYGAVVRINDDCTATQIAPRFLVTASHCIRTSVGDVSGAFAPGHPLTVESRKPDGTLTLTKIPIASAKVHPRIKEVCAQENDGAGCEGSSAGAARDAPDIAIIKLAGDIPNATVTPISATPARAGELLIPAGFGCATGGGSTDDTLRIGTTPVIDSSEVAHEGSPVSADEAKQLANVYFYTEGPALHDHYVAGLCPGDSGGPIFRKTATDVVLVGISSSYTFRPNAAATPATNWFSRVDAFAKYEVYAWLANEGTTLAQ